MNHRRGFGLAVAVALLVAPAAYARDLVITWVAPGDDNLSGRATSYDLRYKTTTVAGTDTLTWWNNAAPVVTKAPKSAGSRDTAYVDVDPYRDAYFILVTVDDAGNRSFFSNIASVRALAPADTTRPATVRGLFARPR